MNPKLHLKSQLVDENTGEIICGCGCGNVIEQRTFNQNNEFEGSEDKREPNSSKRTGTITTQRRHDNNLTTVLSASNSDFEGKKIPFSQLHLFDRLREKQTWVAATSKERRLSTGLQALHIIVSQMELTDSILDESVYIYRKTVEKGLARGKLTFEWSGACVFAACKIKNVPKSLSEFKEKCQFRKIFDRYTRIILLELNLRSTGFSPRQYLDKFCTDLNVHMKVKHIANEILLEEEKRHLAMGRTPTIVCVAAILLANRYLFGKSYGKIKKWSLSESQLQTITGISGISVRAVSKLLEPILHCFDGEFRNDTTN